MNVLKVTKMHALGNNYIYISEFEEELHEAELPDLARALSDVRKGIGSDGMILIGPSESAQVRMRIFNADGYEAETCGNGLRCVAKYAFERGYVENTGFNIETKAGIVQAFVHAAGENAPSVAQVARLNKNELGPREGSVQRVTVDMGEPRFGAGAVNYEGPHTASSSAAATITIGEDAYTGTLVSMGNPHFVSFVEDVENVAVATIGPQLEQHAYFPNRINVEFVAAVGRDELDFRVWERGSGITYACGTGACASVAAGVLSGRLDSRVTVHLLGGDLEIEIRDGRVLMTGEAVHVLSGEFPWPRAN